MQKTNKGYLPDCNVLLQCYNINKGRALFFFPSCKYFQLSYVNVTTLICIFRCDSYMYYCNTYF